MPFAPRSSRGPAGMDVHLCRGEVLVALSRLLDHRPGAEVPHHGRVASIAARIASRLSSVDRRDTFYAGLVHDIGLMGAQRDASHVWNLQEQANQPHMRTHPLIGAQMLSDLPDFYGAAQTVLDHHEWMDGHGYPRGKAGEEIPPAAQVVRFADTCDFVLREQGSPELLAFLDAVRSRTRTQVDARVADTGIEVLGETGFYAQLLATVDVDFLVESTLQRLAADDFTSTDTEVTAFLELFADVADAHPSDKTGHSRRVAHLAVLVAMALGLPPEETVKIRWAALLHDVGIVAVPKSALDRSRLLTPEELDAIRRLTGKASDLLAPIHGMDDVIATALAHSEMFDGSGYPHGLTGYEIPVGARILAVCDTFDALTSQRPYRSARERGLAIDILIRGSGSHFDPDVVSTAVPVLLIRQTADEMHTACV